MHRLKRPGASQLMGLSLHGKKTFHGYIFTMPERSLNDDAFYRSELSKLSEETKKLRKLRELLALKVANRSHCKDLDQLTAQVQRTESELLEMMLKVENFAGEVIERRCKLKLPC